MLPSIPISVSANRTDPSGVVCSKNLCFYCPSIFSFQRSAGFDFSKVQKKMLIHSNLVSTRFHGFPLSSMTRFTFHCLLEFLVLVGLGRFELPTSPLSGVRSNQLSYRPRCVIWWSWTGSNRRPPECKSGALPAELQPLLRANANLALLFKNNFLQTTSTLDHIAVYSISAWFALYSKSVIEASWTPTITIKMTITV